MDLMKKVMKIPNQRKMISKIRIEFNCIFINLFLLIKILFSKIKFGIILNKDYV